MALSPSGRRASVEQAVRRWVLAIRDGGPGGLHPASHALLDELLRIYDAAEVHGATRSDVRAARAQVAPGADEIDPPEVR